MPSWPGWGLSDLFAHYLPVRAIFLAMTVPILLGLALTAGAPEPVVWTKMADPDPHFVAPRAEKMRRSSPNAAAGRSLEPETLDTAVANLREAVRHADEVQRGYEREARRLEEMVE